MLLHLGAVLGKNKRASTSQKQYFGGGSLFDAINRPEKIGVVFQKDLV